MLKYVEQHITWKQITNVQKMHKILSTDNLLQNVTKQVDAAEMLSTIWDVVGLNLNQDPVAFLSPSKQMLG
jgi:hypothetical protein